MGDRRPAVLSTPCANCAVYLVFVNYDVDGDLIPLDDNLYPTRMDLQVAEMLEGTYSKCPICGTENELYISVGTLPFELRARNIKKEERRVNYDSE